jgi:hypothetical protein
VSDEQQIRALIESDPEFAQFLVYDSAFGQVSGAPSLPISGSPILALDDWFRKLDDVDVDVDIQVEGATATVTSTATMTGSLVLKEMTEGGVVEHDKPLVDVAHRSLQLERHGSGKVQGDNRWHIVAVSGLEVESAVDDAAPTVQIQSIRLEPAGRDPIEITDPSALTARRDFIRLNPHEEVVITVTLNGVPAVGFLHFGGRNEGQRMRLPLELQTDGTLRGTWIVPAPGGFNHASVDLMTEGALFETDPAMAPYDSNQWGFIYRSGLSEGEE